MLFWITFSPQLISCLNTWIKNYLECVTVPLSTKQNFVLSQSHFSPCPSLNSQCGRHVCKRGFLMWIYFSQIIITWWWANWSGAITAVKLSSLISLSRPLPPWRNLQRQLSPSTWTCIVGWAEEMGSPGCGLTVGTRQDNVCLAELGRTEEGSGVRAQGQ